MPENLLFGNLSGLLGGTLFSRCFWYSIISVLTVYNDLSNAVQTLHLERRSLKEVASESGDEEPIDITIPT